MYISNGLFWDNPGGIYAKWKIFAIQARATGGGRPYGGMVSAGVPVCCARAGYV